MKQTYLLIMLLIFVTSCGDKQKNLTTEKSPVVEIGSALLDGTNSMTPLFIGESSNQQIWLEYIKAHNDKNLEKIAKINAEDWEGYTADGSVVKGNKAHIEVLDNLLFSN